MSITSEEFAKQIENALGFKVTVCKGDEDMSGYYILSAYGGGGAFTNDKSVLLLTYLIEQGIEEEAGTLDWKLEYHDLKYYRTWSFACRISTITPASKFNIDIPENTKNQLEGFRI